MAASKRNNRGSGSNAGTVFWLAAIVIALFIFALNWGKIQATLARTNFHEIVKTQTGSDAAPSPQPSASPLTASPQAKGEGEKPSATKEPAATAEPQSPAAKAPPAAPKLSPKSTAGTTSQAPQDSSSGDGGSSPAASTKGSSSQQAPQTKPSKPASSAAQGASQGAHNRAALLYFVRIDDDGVILRQEVKRQIPVSDSPLLDSLGALLKGPNEDELRRKLVSLVPQGTKLLSAQVRGSTAVLNFNEAFMYNHYGIEGYAGQLKQVVFTATAFPTVQDVQILIEGEKHDYLGGEGVYIGKPLSRSSF
jgi:germination protein M